MTDSPHLRILGDSANEIGDTLTWLAKDLLHTLGYDDCHFNVHKTGREIDITGKHVFENRRVVAECKARKEKIGGDIISKFAGVLDAERRQQPKTPVEGYFISAYGFTETAIQQEKDFKRPRLTLVDGDTIVRRLQESHIVVTAVEAAQTAARHIQLTMPGLKAVPNKIELLAHSQGWIWAVYFKENDIPSHACLVHADGQVISKRNAAGIELPNIAIVAAADSLDSQELEETYRRFVIHEYGSITLEGLPADQEVSRSFRLENLYVPLRLDPMSSSDSNPEQVKPNEPPQEPEESPAPMLTASLGQALSDNRRISVLGLPGSGKTTLIKRLAVAYSQNRKIAGSEENLPDYEMLPIVIRCRQLGALSSRPILEVLNDIISRMEEIDGPDRFMSLIGQFLRDGKVLLLVDGLDEIPGAGDRSAFVSQLRTFLARYPAVRAVLTSREVGYRIVAGAVQSVCTAFKMSELTDENITALVHAWHREVLGVKPSIEAEASELSQTITNTDRVRRLAVNPLLLTTLLLVRRWIGQLPRKRTILYQKAIEVLLMTWNVEGHEPIDLEEALPQLAFAAYMMMITGRTAATADELAGLFRDARREMPELLGYTTMSVINFLNKVEERSSLLTISGHRLVSGQIQSLYEFKHLTFQEYLAALAIANGWLPNNDRDKAPVDLIRDFIGEESWSEMVTLTAVLSARRGAQIVELLIERASSGDARAGSKLPQQPSAATLSLMRCMADEVLLTPELAREAITTCIPALALFRREGEITSELAGSRYYDMYREIVFSGFTDKITPWGASNTFYSNAIVSIAVTDGAHESRSDGTIFQYVEKLLENSDEESRLRASGILMNYSYMLIGSNYSRKQDILDRKAVRAIQDLLVKLVKKILEEGPRSAAVTYMDTWALTWGGAWLPRTPSLITPLRGHLFEQWYSSKASDIRRYSAWAFHMAPLVGGLEQPKASKRDVSQFLRRQWETAAREAPGERYDLFYSRATIIAGMYLGYPWSRQDLAHMAYISRDDAPYFEPRKRSFFERFITQLGPEGKAVIDELKSLESSIEQNHDPNTDAE